MAFSLLTAANWPIVGQLCWLLGKVMNFIYTMLDNILTTDTGLVGWSIIIYTILVYTCMLPMTVMYRKQRRISRNWQAFSGINWRRMIRMTRWCF